LDEESSGQPLVNYVATLTPRRWLDEIEYVGFVALFTEGKKRQIKSSAFNAAQPPGSHSMYLAPRVSMNTELGDIAVLLSLLSFG